MQRQGLRKRGDGAGEPTWKLSRDQGRGAKSRDPTGGSSGPVWRTQGKGGQSTEDKDSDHCHVHLHIDENYSS